MKKLSAMLLPLCLPLAAAGGCADGAQAPSVPPDVRSAETTEAAAAPNENEKIHAGEIRVIPEKNVLNQAYDHIRVEIVNNSPYPFSWFYEYNLFEEVKGEYVLIDGDGDGITEKRAEDAAREVAGSGETVNDRLYLGQILDGGYARTGKYKLEIPINREVSEEVLFEITDQYIPLDTGLSIRMESGVYHADSSEAFRYFVRNDTAETVEIALAVHVARREDGKWTRLSPSEDYLEAHGSASLWSENCEPHTEWEGQFQLSLAGMLDEALVPGKYRLEKQILFDWYFYEFEVV